MSEIINVIIVADAESIIEVYGGNNNSNTPQQIDPKYIHMVVKEADAISGQGGGELNISARVEDSIRWRETTLSLNAEYSSFLYKFSTNDEGLISTPFPIEATRTVPRPDPEDPLNPQTQEIHDYHWSCEVTRVGQVTYQFSFMILDRNGEKLGYYRWDPFITISN